MLAVEQCRCTLGNSQMSPLAFKTHHHPKKTSSHGFAHFVQNFVIAPLSQNDAWGGGGWDRGSNRWIDA